MPHYFFNYRDGEHFHRDVDGQDLESLDQVREHAERRAREILVELGIDGQAVESQKVEATTGNGKIVTIVPLLAVLQLVNESAGSGTDAGSKNAKAL